MSASQVYHLVTVDNGKTDNASIIRVFSDMAAGRVKNDLRLLNYYNEIPVSYTASIISVENDSVELKVHSHQAVLMKLDSFTLLKSNHFHKELGVHGMAFYVNIQKEKAILHNFAYAQVRAERREAVRVRLANPAPAAYCDPQCTITGKLMDISETGASLLVEALPSLTDEQQGTLGFTLLETQLSIPSTFLRKVKTDNGEVGIFQLKSEKKDTSVLAQFIYQRQVEIIRELKDQIGTD